MPDQLAEGLVEAGRTEEAIARLEALLDQGEHAGHRLRAASLLFNIGKFGDALAHARRVTDAESEHQADAVLLVAYCLRTLKRFREAAKAFLEFAERWPRSPRARIATFSAALCLEELDDWSGAIAIYESLGDDESAFRRAVCMERGGRVDEAAQLFEDFLSRHEDSPEMLKVRFRLGSMRVRQGRIEEGIRHLEETVRLGGETFIGQMARRLMDRARVRAEDMARKIKHYS